jgi:dethiobiotin synthetase
MNAPRFFITGTDTDVGKTRITAGAAKALRHAGWDVTIVKAVQTGIDREEIGDAALAGALAECAFDELVRFRAPADPWSAANDALKKPPLAEDLAKKIGAIPGALVVEGSGGVAVPLNDHQTMCDLVLRCALPVIVVVGLRLGCINHAILTLEYLRARGATVSGLVLVDRFGDVRPDYAQEVESRLEAYASTIARLPYEPDVIVSVDHTADVLAIHPAFKGPV